MSKMRQFFKTLIAASANAQNKANSSRNSTPVVSETNTPKTGTPVPKPRNRNKPPQLVYFENELTRLMKTVPGIRDEQVREIVEYLSSEDTWSDSYDSSDYTSSDLEGNVKQTNRAEIQQQISNSCQEIINKFETVGDEEGDRGDGGLIDDPQLKETAFVYQKLVASITKMTTGEEKPVDIRNSPPIIAKVMHHIGSRLVALMHEVSSGESMKSNSPKPSVRYHRRLQAKISATTTEDDDSTSDSNLDKTDDNNPLNLSRSKSHDLLLSDSKPHYHQSNDTVGEEKEASDYERFSWRGSFESALLANGDSRNKLSMLESSSSALSVLAAKRRSAGDLLFSTKSMSREQLDRVRSCGSIGGGDHDLESSKLWESTQSQESKTSLHRSGIHEDDTDESSDNDHLRTRSTLPRSLQTTTAASTNSLPRLPTTTLQSSGPMQKAQSVYHFFQNNVKSARYRAPGFNRIQTTAPKRAASAPGLQQPLYAPRRADRRNKIHNLTMEETNLSDAATNSPVIGSRNNATTAATMHPVASPQAIVNNQPPTPASVTSDWPSQSDEDIDRLVAMHQNRHNSLSSLGVRSDSMASVYSGAGEGRYGTVTVKGMVEFGMQYNYKQGALEIHVKQCKDLAAVNKNRSDPYVKVYLLPDKSKSGKRKTKVKKHTLNPVFDEVLRFYISVSALESRTLWLTIWHSDMFGRNDFLGEVMISLQNKVFDNPQPQWYQLQERSEPFEDVTTYRGDIIVGLKFIPAESSQSHSHGLSLRKFSMKSNSSSSSANNNNGTTTPTNTTTMRHSKGSLHILVKEAKHLSPVKASGLCDAFCKSYLLPDKNRSSKQKTPVAKRTTNPTWNYTFIYEDVTLADLSERALELTIWDHDRLASNEFLGGVRFSLGTGKYYGRIAEWNDASGKELSLWQNMLNRPNFWVEGCLSLRSSLDSKTTS
jgi:synaptotagmin-like protein